MTRFVARRSRSPLPSVEGLTSQHPSLAMPREIVHRARMTATERIDSPRGHTRAGSLAWVAFAYAVALGIAIPTLVMLREGAHLAVEGPLGDYAHLAIADAVATLVIFAFSFGLKNSSVYDAYWMAAPPLFLVGGWALASYPTGMNARQVLTLLIILAWAARLTWNWIRGWSGLDHEDFRYRDLQKKTGRAYWLVSLFGLHYFPTALVLVTMLPIAAITAPAGASLGLYDAIGAAISIMGIIVQAIADEQLRAFVKQKTDPDQICERGLWRFSRHPNYFGEISFWTGLAFLALGSGHASWWSFAGIVAILGLFVFASIPMMEGRQKRKPGWAEYARRTSVLVPMPRGR